jgi:hypothetical protein
MITTVREFDFVRNEVEGQVTVKELLDYAQENVDGWISDPVLWDLSHGSLADDPSDYEMVHATVVNAHDLAVLRRHARTAFLAPDNSTYGMLKTAITIVEKTQDYAVASVFRDSQTAIAWLRTGH